MCHLLTNPWTIEDAGGSAAPSARAYEEGVYSSLDLSLSDPKPKKTTHPPPFLDNLVVETVHFLLNMKV